MHAPRITTLMIAALLMGGCAGSSPTIRVIGVGEAQRSSQPNRLIVLVEVVNPSPTEMVLSKLQYRLECDAWEPLKGTIALSRSVPPHSSEVFQIPITLRDTIASSKGVDGLGYLLVGRLFAVGQSWRVFAKGTFRAAANASRSPVVRIAASQ